MNAVNNAEGKRSGAAFTANSHQATQNGRKVAGQLSNGVTDAGLTVAGIALFVLGGLVLMWENLKHRVQSVTK
jgi:hypothetical protein